MKFEEKWKKYIGILIFVFVFIVSGILTFYFRDFFKVYEVGIFITLSSWLFSIFSFLFIFIVWDKFTYSSYKKIKREKKYLDDEAIKELNIVVGDIYIFFNGQDDSVNLFESCLKVKKIAELLKKTREDCELNAYKRGITTFSSFLNKKSIKNIKSYEDEKLNRLSKKDKEKILDMSFTLKEDLTRILTT
ncbi:hypothetical protein ACP272_13115 (plasmid) [Staphylococcus xylosus]|uniref:hypothetical protein n=1 Tax=Staphylococcus xylosus TaxID=1288 RepID=UPI003CF81CF6